MLVVPIQEINNHKYNGNDKTINTNLSTKKSLHQLIIPFKYLLSNGINEDVHSMLMSTCIHRLPHTQSRYRRGHMPSPGPPVDRVGDHGWIRQQRCVDVLILFVIHVIKKGWEVSVRAEARRLLQAPDRVGHLRCLRGWFQGWEPGCSAVRPEAHPRAHPADRDLAFLRMPETHLFAEAIYRFVIESPFTGKKRK